MIIEHRGVVPRIHRTAWIAPNAVISGDVEVGEETRVLYGAVLTSEGAPVKVGARCVIMEHAVIRGAGSRSSRFPAEIGDHVLVGPHAHLSGCSIGANSFIATGCIVFNGARIGAGSVVALNGIVHTDTLLPEGSVVPIQHVAVGNPGRIYNPSQWDEIRNGLDDMKLFRRKVFGIETGDRTFADTYHEMLERYTRGLAIHRQDRVVPE
jgi:carbonic anhydrase/acetyltransferase-like protein (isoleucine patch superfamily)